MVFSGDQKFDAIIIGSGLGGLSCALHLAKQGLKVLTLEKQPKVGGYAQNFQRGDFTFDVSLHIAPALTPGQGLASIFSDLNIFDKLNIVKRTPMYRSSFPDRDYDLPSGQEEATEYLCSAFPKDEKGIREFMAICQKVVSSNFKLFWDNSEDVLTYFPKQYYHRTYTSLLQECTANQKFHGLMGQLWQSTGLPNDRCAANWAVEVMGTHLLTGNYYLAGGGGHLTQILANALDEAGCPVLTCSKVETILLEKRHVCGVRLADGRQFSAPIVVSNANPIQTYRDLLPAGIISSAFLEKNLGSLEPSCSLLTMYIGLDCPAKTIGLQQHSQFFNNSYDNNHSYNLAMDERYRETDFVVSDYTTNDGSNHPAGCGIIEMLEAAPGAPWLKLGRDKYLAKKAAVKEIMLQKLSQKFPQVKDHLVVCELATPRTLATVSRNPDGAVYGWAQTPEQADIFRFNNPAVGGIKGLYFAGAWGRGGGGGYMGSFVNGRVSAREIIAREGLGSKEPRTFINYPPLEEQPMFGKKDTPECTYELRAEDLNNGAIQAELFLKLFRQLQNNLAAAPKKEIVQMTMMVVPGKIMSSGTNIKAQLKLQNTSDGKTTLFLVLTTTSGQRLGHLIGVCAQ